MLRCPLILIWMCYRRTELTIIGMSITTPSPLPGQAALRGESGCSPRKALPGPSSAAPSTSSSSRWAGAAAYLSTQVRASHQSGKTLDSCTVSSLFFGQYTRSCAGLLRWAAALGCCAGLLRWAAAASCCGVVLRRRAAAACWRSAWGTQALKTRHKLVASY